MLTTPQQLLVKAYVEADVVLNALPPSNGSALQIANTLNEPTNPAWIMWRLKVSQDEIMQNGFDWTQADNLSVGQARIWEWLFNNAERAINPSKPNVQQGIIECWKGTAAKVAVKDAVMVHCKRTALLVEKICSTGTGSTASPATLVGNEGAVSYFDIILAMGWPY